MSANNPTIQLVKAEELLLLRQKILRPDQPLDASRYAGDDEGLHLAAVAGTEVVACATLVLGDRPGHDDPRAWRLRGMATTPETRGTGLGGRVLAAALAEVQQRGASSVWCNARTPAAGFYLRFGFTIDSDVFELPLIGPHYLMRLVF